MSEQHTQGRLTTDEAEHDEPYQNIKLQAGKHHTVATVWIDDAPLCDFNAMQRANARRLAACWNACIGIDTDDLDAHSVNILHKLHDDAAKRVLSERDELLTELQSMVAAFHPPTDELDGATEEYLMEWFPTWTRARATLTKHKTQNTRRASSQDIMNTSPIPTVTVTAHRPSKAHAGFATAIKMNGIDFIVITAHTKDLQPLMQSIGFVDPIDMAMVKPVAVLAKHSVDVVVAA